MVPMATSIIVRAQESDSPPSGQSLVGNRAQAFNRPPYLGESTQTQREVWSYPSCGTKLPKTDAPDKEAILCKLSQYGQYSLMGHVPKNGERASGFLEVSKQESHPGVYWGPEEGWVRGSYLKLHHRVVLKG